MRRELLRDALDLFVDGSNKHFVLGYFFLKGAELILESFHPALGEGDFLRGDLRLFSCHSGILSRQGVILALFTLLLSYATLDGALLSHHDYTFGHRDFLLLQSQFMLQQ